MFPLCLCACCLLLVAVSLQYQAVHFKVTALEEVNSVAIIHNNLMSELERNTISESRLENKAADPEEASTKDLVEMSYCPNEIKNVRVMEDPCNMDTIDEVNIEMRTVSDPGEMMGTMEKLSYITDLLRCECILI